MLNPDAIDANTDSFPHLSGSSRMVSTSWDALTATSSRFQQTVVTCSGISKWRLCLIPMQLQCILRSLTISLNIWGPSSIWNTTDVQGSTSDFKMASFPCGPVGCFVIITNFTVRSVNWFRQAATTRSVRNWEWQYEQMTVLKYIDNFRIASAACGPTESQ